MQDLLLILKEIAYNLQWCWNKNALELFHDINPEFWNWSGHNPVKLLNEINQSYLEFIIEKKESRKQNLKHLFRIQILSD